MEDVFKIILIFVAIIFALYIGAMAFGSLSTTLIPTDVYGNGTIWEGGVGGTEELNQTLENFDVTANSAFNMMSMLPVMVIGFGLLLLLGSALGSR